jgi:hypothetical protein
MNIINRFFNYIVKKQQKVSLGRWNIDHNIKQINQKVDLSNEDHCGPCGQYIVKKKYEDILYKNINKDKNINHK